MQTSAIVVGASPPRCDRPRAIVDSHAALHQTAVHSLRPRCSLQCREQRSGRIQRNRSYSACRAAAAAGESSNGAAAVLAASPKPSVKIDNQTDPFSTIVIIQYGDLLGDQLDTVAALKNLGLNIKRAKLQTTDTGVRHKFFITDSLTAEKITKSSRLEDIRLTILNNLMLFHPESTYELAWGLRATAGYESDGNSSTLGVRSRRAVATDITVEDDEAGVFSKLFISTVDRPGLLVEIVRVLKDISVNVISAEVDTEGSRAIDTFYVSYHGEPLNSSMEQLVTNALQYYLSLTEIEKEESY